MKQLVSSYEIISALVKDSKQQPTNHYKNRVDLTPLPTLPLRNIRLEELYDKRTSIRFFDSNRPIEIEDLDDLLFSTFAYYRQIWKTDREEGIELECYVFPESVTGDLLDPQHIFRYNQDERSFERITDAPYQRAKEDIVLQTEFANAPVILVFVGNLARATKQSGTNGYRKMLTTGGSLAYYSWLHALALGYEGTVFAGVLPRALQQICDIDGFRKFQVFAFCFGHRMPNYVVEGSNM